MSSFLRIMQVCEALHSTAPPFRPTTLEEMERLRAVPLLGVTAWELVLELYSSSARSHAVTPNSGTARSLSISSRVVGRKGGAVECRASHTCMMRRKEDMSVHLHVP